jgi:hypothetical protein
MTPNIELSELRSQIEHVFENVPYPGDDHLAEMDIYFELEKICDFQGKSWRDIDLAWLCEHRDSQTFLTPEAYRYYLPAYLIATATDPPGAGMMGFCLSRSLDPAACDNEPYGNGLVHRRRVFERVQPLTVEQKRAVRSFLRYTLQRYPNDREARSALDSYWDKACDEQDGVQGQPPDLE